MKLINASGIASGGSTKSTRPVAITLVGMPDWPAVSGACAITMPPAAFTARAPSVPSVPVPERMMQIDRSC